MGVICPYYSHNSWTKRKISEDDYLSDEFRDLDELEDEYDEEDEEDEDEESEED